MYMFEIQVTFGVFDVCFLNFIVIFIYFVINAYLGDSYYYWLDLAVLLGIFVVLSWLGACFFLRLWVYFLAGKFCGCRREWLGSEFNVILYIICMLFWFYFFLVLLGIWLPLVFVCFLFVAAFCCCTAA